MHGYKTLAALCALSATLGALQAQAQTVVFSGTRQNVNPLNPPGTGRCVPPYFNTVDIRPGQLSSTGTSNIGTFESTQSHCIVSAPPTAVVDGQFTYRFAGGDTIFGTYSGTTNTTATPGTFAGMENLVITGGTGRFVGATGTISSNGTLQFVSGNGVFSGTVNGLINATATTQTGTYATAFGQGTAAISDYASAFGGLAYASANNATAIGALAEATGVNATAVGADTAASGVSSTALGYGAAASGTAGSALGHNSVAGGLGSTAVGVASRATDVGATALGRLANASAANATAIGANSIAGFAGSTALGTGATTTAANQVTLGGTGSSVRVGDIAASTAAQTGTVGLVTVDANGTLGRNTSLLGSVDMLGSRVATLFDLRDADQGEWRRGIAAATAMGNAHFPSAPGKTSYVLNGAVFRGQAAVGGSLMHRFDSETPIALSVGFSFAGKGDNAFKAGVAGEF
ncbi:MAG: hypothetical protein ACREBO_14175 [Novosphingobium sp.]